MSIEEIMAKLSKNTRKRIQLASEIKNEKLPLASVSLTAALDGGLTRGRVSTIWGNKSASKTSLLLQTAGELQKQGYSTAFIDAERSYDPVWAATLGVDNSEMIVSEASSVDEMTQVVIELCEAEVDFIIIDSVSGLIPSSYYTKDEKTNDIHLHEGLEGSKQIGTLSKELGNSLQRINTMNKRSIVVFISQTRNKITSWGAMGQAQGGNALMFFSSVVVRLQSSATDKEQIKSKKQFGDKILAIPIGRSVDYTVQYSKSSPPGLTGSYDFYYAGELIGIDQIGEIADTAVKNGIVEQAGSWFNYGELKMQGRSSLINWLKEDEAIREEILRKMDV